MNFLKTFVIPLLAYGMLLSACGTKDSSPVSSNNESSLESSSSSVEEWTTISYQEIKQAYDNRQSSPYNHREYTYYDVGNPYKAVEDYDGGKWVIDKEKSEGNPSSSPLEWFESQYTIATYEPYLDQFQMTIEKKEAEQMYRYRVEIDNGGHIMVQDVLVDQYFNYYKALQYMDEELSGGMKDAVYSTK